MGTSMTVENITESEFRQLQQLGWILVCVDNYLYKKFVYRFKKN
jgi:hypothetical protein